MNGKRIAIGVLAVGSVAVASIGVSVAAPASKSHTMSFKAKETSEKRFGAQFIDSDKDRANGKQIGSDVLSGTYDPKTNSVSGDVAFALKGGIIYGTVRQDVSKQHAPVTGRITGGTGRYRGIAGTISGDQASKTATSLTLTYK